MKKVELAAELIRMNIPKDMYCLDGGLPNEAYCLNRYGDVWEVYYSERGNKSGFKTFTSEHEACFYLRELLTKQFGQFFDK